MRFLMPGVLLQTGKCPDLAQDFCLGLRYFKQNLPSRLNLTLEPHVNVTQKTPLSPCEDIELLSQTSWGTKLLCWALLSVMFSVSLSLHR